VSHQLSEMVDEISKEEFKDEDSEFGNITDEDIDSLFQ